MPAGRGKRPKYVNCTPYMTGAGIDTCCKPWNNGEHLRHRSTRGISGEQGRGMSIRVNLKLWNEECGGQVKIVWNERNSTAIITT
jgi:hypothetical protein